MNRSRRTRRPRSSLQIHLPVFGVSALLVLLLVLTTRLGPDQAAAIFGGMKAWALAAGDWLFVLAANLFVVTLVAIAISPHGRRRIGGDGARPDYSYPAWLAMLFAAGVGIGLMFFGVLEPVTHTLNPPLGIDASDVASARAAGMSAAIFHWGLHAWAIYGVVGLSLAWFCYNQRQPLTISSAFRPILGDRVRAWPGHLIDVLAVLATLFGLATSLGYGAEQINAGLNYLFGLEINEFQKVLIIVTITAIALASVLAGLDRGIKRLSAINMTLAAGLMLFVLLAGPTAELITGIGRSARDYLVHLPGLSQWWGREDTAFFQDWTAFYWAWWISWSPFVGMFIARISFGRTIREFVIWVLVMPTVIGITWMSVFGGTALHQLFSEGYRGVADSVPELALFRMLEMLPWPGFFSAIGMMLTAIFFITSADSGALVVDIITAGGRLRTPRVQRAFWCLLGGGVAVTLLVTGGLGALQALTIFIGLPFTVLLLAMVVSLLRGLSEPVRA